jgi:flagellar basal body-associated protein FliL
VAGTGNWYTPHPEDRTVATTPTAEPTKTRRGPRMVVVVLVCLICTAAGAAVPFVVNAGPLFHRDAPAPAGKADQGPKTVPVAFGDVVVNLNEDRMSRYLRVKIVLAVDAPQEKAATAHLAKYKAQLKNWLIGHLSGKGLKDVAGSVGVKRLQRELLEHFEDVLYPDGDGPLREVLFEEFVVQ